MKNVAETNRKSELLNRALDAVKDYNQALDDTAHAGTLEDHVRALIGGEEYAMVPFDYRTVCVKVLTELAKPEFALIVKDKLGGYSYGVLLNMLESMTGFCNMVSLPVFQSQLLLNDIQNNYDDYDENELNELIAEYTEKAKGIIGRSQIKALAQSI